jgi:DNA repair exonuclease SbcCD ATPase subunit
VPSSVCISRLVVEEGFLDGLDLTFTQGLNVVIGPRGVGKTSIIQLLRFCLGVPAFAESFQASAISHAHEVLGADGRVSVELMVDGEALVVSRRKRDDQPEGRIEAIGEPLILAQTEVEEIGIDPEGRLRLLDDFRPNKGRINDRERALVSTAQSLTLELGQLAASIDHERRELTNLEQESAQLAEMEQQLAIAAKESTTGANTDLARLDTLGRVGAEARVRLAALEKASDALASWIEGLKSIPRRMPMVERWPTDELDPLIPAREAIRELEAHFEAGAVRFGAIQDELTEGASREAARINEIEDEARDIRRRVEQVQEGAGLAARRVAALRERVAQLNALAGIVEEREARHGNVRQTRDEAIDALESVRDERFAERLSTGQALNADLGPRTRGRRDPATRDYLQRKEAEGKSRIEALRCLKRLLARRYHRLLSAPTVGADEIESKGLRDEPADSFPALVANDTVDY